MNHEVIFKALVAESPFIDSNGIKVVCYIVDRDRSVVGYNKPVVETSKLWVHAELDAVLKYQQFRFIDEFEHVQCFVNKPPCSYCLRLLKYCFKNLKVELFTDEDTVEFQSNALELQVDYQIFPGLSK